MFSVFSDADRYEVQAAASMTSPRKSPHRYSPSVYSHQVDATNLLYHLFPNHQSPDRVLSIDINIQAAWWPVALFTFYFPVIWIQDSLNVACKKNKMATAKMPNSRLQNGIPQSDGGRHSPLLLYSQGYPWCHANVAF